MKQRNYLTRLASASAAALSVFLLAASCSTDDYAAPDPGTPDGQIRFEISFAPRDGAAHDEAAQLGGPATRVSTDTQFNSNWQDGDAIGIFAVAHGSPLAATGNPIHNVKLTYSSANSNWTPEEPLYWPTRTGSYDFYAYYPYDAALTDPTQLTFSAKADQSAKDATNGRPHFNLSDLLRATANNEGKGFTRGQSVSLSFAHVMALVEVKVSSSMLGDYDPATLAVTLNGCSTTQTLNLADGSLSGQSAPESIRMYPCPNDGATGTYSYRALVAAGTTVPAETSLFLFRYGKKDLLVSPKLTEQLTLAQGRAETFSIDFPFTSVAVSPTVRIADFIPEAERAKVTRLSVTGEMTADDFTFIREQLPNITSLDLSQATVEGDTIPDRALYDKKSLQEFSFPAGITAIGKKAFYYCTNLTGSLIIPKGVTSIGESAFRSCMGFTGTLTLPEGMETIGETAFIDCTSFTGTLTLPASLKTIGSYAFANCSNFTGSLTIHKGIETISKSAFQYCGFAGGTLTLPEGVKTIGDNAFKECTGFTGTLSIPASVTAIGNSAFNGCTGFTGTLTIPASVKTIGDNAFKECTGFTGSLTIPEGVTSIGADAFNSCSGFTGTLTIPEGITSIGEWAFTMCSQITSITCHIANLGNVSFGDNIGDTVVFGGMRAVTAVYVPAAAVDAYKAHPAWSLFDDIIQPIPNNN